MDPTMTSKDVVMLCELSPWLMLGVVTHKGWQYGSKNAGVLKNIRSVLNSNGFGSKKGAPKKHLKNKNVGNGKKYEKYWKIDQTSGPITKKMSSLFVPSPFFSITAPQRAFSQSVWALLSPQTSRVPSAWWVGNQRWPPRWRRAPRGVETVRIRLFVFKTGPPNH